MDLDIEGMTENGNQYAQAYLGSMHNYGKGVNRNHLTAVKWDRKVAEQGYARAQNNLGVM